MYNTKFLDSLWAKTDLSSLIDETSVRTLCGSDKGLAMAVLLTCAPLPWRKDVDPERMRKRADVMEAIRLYRESAA